MQPEFLAVDCQLGYPLLQGYSSTSINWIAVEARVYLGFLSTTRNELLWARFSSLLWDKQKPQFGSLFP
jgi:hypothetical protein